MADDLVDGTLEERNAKGGVQNHPVLLAEVFCRWVVGGWKVVGWWVVDGVVGGWWWVGSW